MKLRLRTIFTLMLVFVLTSMLTACFPPPRHHRYPAPRPVRHKAPPPRHHRSDLINVQTLVAQLGNNVVIQCSALNGTELFMAHVPPPPPRLHKPLPPRKRYHRPPPPPPRHPKRPPHHTPPPPPPHHHGVLGHSHVA